MLIDKQDKNKKDYYEKMLQVVGSLSNLFSESEDPYLHYRVAENLFCKSFDAENHSRGDTSADASLNGVGIGLKTFLSGKTGNKMEKVAEFNNDSTSFRTLSPQEQAKEIARLRNERIETTMRIYGLTNMIYHCVTRSKGKMSIIETPMNLVNISKIKMGKITPKSISFSDGTEEYLFNISKSTLFKRFKIKDELMNISVEIIKDPFDALEKLVTPEAKALINPELESPKDLKKQIYLPLFSPSSPRGNRKVEPGSGLNTWNSKGRKRDLNEVYIPIPAWIHRDFKDFFPPQDQSFSLQLPDKKFLQAKVCQEGGKALMSNPNEALGQWILREILLIPDGELVTYKKLEDLGLDSVVIYKLSEGRYAIDFAKIGSYDAFEDDNKTLKS